MVLPDDYDLDEQLNILNDKLKTKYENISEFPANVRQLVGQFSSLGVDNIKEIVYLNLINHVRKK